MTQLNPMRCISVRNGKYRVALRRMYAEFELDELANAIKFRNAIEAQNKKTPRHTSYNKVLTLCVGHKPMCTIVGVSYHTIRRCYTASWPRCDELDDTAALKHTASFSVATYGHIGAKALAVAARLAGIANKEYIVPHRAPHLRSRFLMKKPAWMHYLFEQNGSKVGFFYAFFDEVDGVNIKMEVQDGENEYVLEALTSLYSKYQAKARESKPAASKKQSKRLEARGLSA